MTTPPPTCSSLEEFLESVPPASPRLIAGLFERKWSSPSIGKSTDYHAVKKVDLSLVCSTCDGQRVFRCISSDLVHRSTNHFLEFQCRNCQRSYKTYAVRLERTEDDATSVAGFGVKYGEIPSFGPSLPGRLMSLLREDADLLSKGRRAENQSMGLGAFGYYRRVVENQKKHVFEEVARVADKLEHPDVAKVYRAAAAETRFTEAFEMVKDALPTVLLIENRNPLTLLHAALSDGLHAREDVECLEIAGDVRVLLAQLADRITTALEDHDEISAAVKRLAKRVASGPKIGE